jgi:phenylacetate-CoA ligase
MKRVEGRTFDLIIGTNGNFVAGTFWTLLFRSVPGISMFRVHQTGADTINILIEPEAGFINNSIKLLEKTIKDKLGDDMKIKFDVVERIPNTESGKHRFIISDLAKEHFK